MKIVSEDKVFMFVCVFNFHLCLNLFFYFYFFVFKYHLGFFCFLIYFFVSITILHFSAMSNYIHIGTFISNICNQYQEHELHVDTQQNQVVESKTTDILAEWEHEKPVEVRYSCPLSDFVIYCNYNNTVVCSNTAEHQVV